jgi:hypothetical protein
MRATIHRLVARLRRRPPGRDLASDIEPWEPIRTTARQLSVHGLEPWPDAAGVSWPGGVIECPDHLTPSAWVDDVSALVLRGRPGGTIHQRIRRLSQRCRDTAVR